MAQGTLAPTLPSEAEANIVRESSRLVASRLGSTEPRRLGLTDDSQFSPGEEMEALHGLNLVRQFGVPSGQPEYSSRGQVEWALDSARDVGRKVRVFRARPELK
jgi:hypothetical protein